MANVSINVSGNTPISIHVDSDEPVNITLKEEQGHDDSDIDSGYQSGASSGYNTPVNARYSGAGQQAGPNGPSLSMTAMLTQILQGLMDKDSDDGEAMSTMRQFQNNAGMKTLSLDNVKEMAETGYYTDNAGAKHLVSKDEQEAAQHMLTPDSSGQSLFQRLDANDGRPNNGRTDMNNASAPTTDYSFLKPQSRTSDMPSDASAAKTIRDFQNSDMGGANISNTQVAEMARTGYFTDASGQKHLVTPEQQKAAQAMMADGGALFKKLEASTDGQHDGMLGTGDYDQAVSKGTINPGSNSTNGGSTNYGLQFSLPPGFSMGNAQGSNLPSDSSAAKTMNNFQNSVPMGMGKLISDTQMEEMAKTGYFTDPMGQKHLVSPEVQKAAQAMMANGGELFHKLESSTDGKNDGKLGAGDYQQAINNGTISANPNTVGGVGNNMPTSGQQITLTLPANFNGGQNSLPSDSSAAKSINDFQKNNDMGLINDQQVAEMAQTGYCTKSDGTKVQCTPEEQKAAKAMMANGGELFHKLEASTDGKNDGQLGQGDYQQAINKGTISANPDDPDGPGNQKRGHQIVLTLPPEFQTGSQNLPSDSAAAKSINGFQKDNNMGLISNQQVAEMAKTGYCTKDDGSVVTCTPEQQQAAKAMMANGGKLFQDLEAQTNGQHDGQLGQGDYDEAIKNQRISADPSTTDGPGNSSPFQGQLPTITLGMGQALPSDSSAAKSINNFQKNNDMGLINDQQVAEMAQTGYCTKSDGTKVQCTPEEQQAAKAMMANGGELFHKLEASTDGKNDGQLGQGDYQQAINKGTISSDPSVVGGAGNTPNQSPMTITLNPTSGNGSQSNLPSDSQAAKTMHDFQDSIPLGMGKLVSDKQMQEMAETGYMTTPMGKIKVPQEVQDAAKAMMANGGELFHKMESSTDGQHDGQLGSGDYQQAINKGTISADPSVAGGVGNNPGSSANGQPITITLRPDDGGRNAGSGMSDSASAKKINEFQNSSMGGEKISDTQMAELAQTGYYTDPAGQKHLASADVQNAAQHMMANGGELFHKLESSTDGQNDGLLGAGDYQQAINKGTISADPSIAGGAGNSTNQNPQISIEIAA